VRVTTSDGHRLHVTTDGSTGIPLVFSNSLGTDLTLWDQQADALRQTLTVCRYDTRGHGQSDAPGGAYALEQLGRDLLSVAEAVSQDPVDLCGISIGGMTVLWAAIHAPHRVRRLVVANSAARIGDRAMWDERIRQTRADGLAPLASAAMERWFTPEYRARERETVERIRAAFLRTSLDGYAGCCAALRDADLRDLVHQVQCPTLVIAGAKDPATPPDGSKWLAQQIKGAEYLELECAHLSNVECAGSFTAAVGSFLRT
jgi:3-oxoadipate enol-lactonase